MVAPILAGTTPSPGTDGITYSNAVPLTANEADLWNGVIIDPIATVFGYAIVAVIKLSISGSIGSNLTNIFLQQDMGDGNWVDINWLLFNQTSGSATFVFSNGCPCANTFQQTRNAGMPPNPNANGSNQTALAGRLRFIGFANVQISGSSSSPGAPTGITATIKYKLIPLS